MPSFLLAVYHDADGDGANPHDNGTVYESRDAQAAAFTRVNAFNERLMASEAFVFACGLTAPGEARVVDANAASVTPGTRSAAGPTLGGFWVVRADDEAAATQLAREASAACGQPIELRQLQGE